MDFDQLIFWLAGIAYVLFPLLKRLAPWLKKRRLRAAGHGRSIVVAEPSGTPTAVATDWQAVEALDRDCGSERQAPLAPRPASPIVGSPGKILGALPAVAAGSSPDDLSRSELRESFVLHTLLAPPQALRRRRALLASPVPRWPDVRGRPFARLPGGASSAG